MASRSNPIDFNGMPYERRMAWIAANARYWLEHEIPFQLEKQDEHQPNRTVRNHVPFYGNR